MEQRLAQLESEVRELRQMLANKELTDSNIPKALAPYEAGTVASAEGVIPVWINGERFDLLVNKT